MGRTDGFDHNFVQEMIDVVIYCYIVHKTWRN